MSDNIRKYVEDILWIKDELSGMDEAVETVLGLRDWDDAVCVDFQGRLLASTDGPYTMRLVLKSALVHASTDVVAKGGRPFFALDTLIGSRSDLEKMIASLKRQAEAIDTPLIGGNTLVEDAEPRCSLTVVGKLLLDEPVRDDGAEDDDVIVLVGEPVWGSQDDRLDKAKTMFDAWFDALENVSFTSAKDVTKGGLVSVVYEMEKKTNRKFELTDEIPYSKTRNLDNFIATLAEKDYVNLEKVCMRHGCPLKRIGKVI